MTASADYPTEGVPYDNSHNVGDDVFVSKLNSTLSSLLASTFIGGGNDDGGSSIALDDGSGNVYVTGFAGAGYPTIGNPYDAIHKGGDDVFVSKLNSTLSSLLASTFIGGGNSEEGWSIALDGSENVYITGYTTDDPTTDYPTIGNSYDPIHNGDNDIFISKLNSTLSSLSVSTFIGGGGTDDGHSIILDTSGNVYITGKAQSGYPTIGNPYDPSHNGGWDVFVSKLDSNLSADPSTTTTAAAATTAATTAPASTTTVDPNATTTTPAQSTTTTVSPTTTTPGTTTAPVTTTSSVECSISIAPGTAEVVSGESVQFTINPSGDCATQNIEWSVEGTIGSSIDSNGNYTAGTNIDFFNKATDVVVATDYANGDITAQATVSVSWGCFLLQIYGEDSEEAELLRYFRDNVLNQSEHGQALIKFYSEWSPVIVTAMEADEEFRNQLKGVIEGTLFLIREGRKKDPPLIPEVK